MSKKSQHVVPTKNGGWAVRRADSDRNTSHHATKSEAIQAARSIAQNQGSEMVIHGKDGQIISRDCHGSGFAASRDKAERIKPVGSSATKISLPAIKKAIAALRPADQTAIRQWMDSKGQHKQAKPKSPLKWPDFEARQKAIFGNRVLPDSQAVLNDVREDRF